MTRVRGFGTVHGRLRGAQSFGFRVGNKLMATTVLDYLSSHSLATLATASKGGIPHATPAFYANDGVTIYFSVADDSTTARNLAENPVAAVGVSDEPEQWGQATGAQLKGAV